MALQTRRPAPGAESAQNAPGGWLMLAVLLLGQFMCVIDVLVVNVAMPSMSGTACWLAALSAASLLAATIMVRAARGRPRSLPAGPRARRSGTATATKGDRRARGRRQPDKFGHDEGDERDHVGDERDPGAPHPAVLAAARARQAAR